jgi:hypothetical protein
MNTSLRLLTREGAIEVNFAAVLTPEQYSRFFECVQTANTKAEMKDSIDQVAGEYGLSVVIDEPYSSLANQLMRQPP